MAEKVQVEYVHHAGDKKPGDTKVMDRREATRLVESGVAKIVAKK